MPVESDFRSILKGQNLKPFLQRSDSQAWWLLLVNYSLLAVAFALPILWFNIGTVIISLILLGNRQLGLGILMHDCVHAALFNSKTLNKRIGEWCCAGPILAQFEGYRRYHLRHHAKAGTTDDPDYPNYRPYPVAKASLRRKLIRDTFGITGVKNLALLMLMHAGVVEYDMAYKSANEKRALSIWDMLVNLAKNLAPALLFHIALALLLWRLGYVQFYGLWWIAYLTTFQFFSRLRNAAEHAGVPDLLNTDPRLHARTVYARWWERLTVAPNHVNYHLEHHWLPAVPPYRLAAFHAWLKQVGALNDTSIPVGYGEVLKAMVRPARHA